MCGITSVVTNKLAVPILLNGIRRLEYRGYDSAGIAVIEKNEIQSVKAEGKVEVLENKIDYEFTSGIGIAHTRWATHGVPCEKNAHPHVIKDRFAIVHNGIIENYAEIKSSLEKRGYKFHSDTDTEVIGVLLYDKVMDSQENSFLAMQEIQSELQGSYALAIIDKLTPKQLLVARKNSPLVIGVGVGENFVASDVLALQGLTDKFVFLEDEDVAYINQETYYIVNNRRRVMRDVKVNKLNYNDAGKGVFKHFMQKEIHEQPDAARRTLCSEISNLKMDFDNIQIVACGSSYYAGLIASFWIESELNIKCFVDIASEFRYKAQIDTEKTLLLTISQSGETADTLSVLRDLGKNYYSTLTICNVPFSSMIRESKNHILTLAGPEVGVATTKALTAQLTSLFLLKRHIASFRNQKVQDTNIHMLPANIEKILRLDNVIKTVAKKFEFVDNTLFLGRGMHFAVAQEGALKLKEISYIHAEAYPAGELKHGPLALIDKNSIVVAVVPNDNLFLKNKSNLQEIKSRKGKLIVFTNLDSNIESDESMIVVKLPVEYDLLSPMYFIIALQLLAYHVSVLKGTDVDRPRNLAKSVTVE